MTLMPGSVLQQGKYVIQTVLKHSKLSTTYQAIHTYLDQPVVLQTIHESLRDRDNFAQLRHQFITEVRYLVRHQPSAIEVLDCFEEAGMPFMALRATAPGTIAENALPDIDTWLKALLPDLMVPTKPSLPEVSVAEVTNPSAVVNFSATALPEPMDRAGNPVAASPETAPPSIPTEVAAPPVAAETTASHSKVWVGQAAASKHYRRLPLALLMASVIAGIGGTSFGFTLRFQRPHTLNSSGGLGKTFFNREQSFPATDQWPETEIPEIPDDGVIDGMHIEPPDYRSRSTSIDQPDYRSGQEFTDYAQPFTEVPFNDPGVASEWAPVPQEVEPVPEAIDEPFMAEPIPAAEPLKPSVMPEVGDPSLDFGAGVEQFQPAKPNPVPSLAAPPLLPPDAPVVAQ